MSRGKLMTWTGAGGTLEIVAGGTVERECAERGERIYTLDELPELLDEIRRSASAGTGVEAQENIGLEEAPVPAPISVGELRSLFDDEPEPPQVAYRGQYAGAEPTATEAMSGGAIEKETSGPLQPGKAGHRALMAFSDGERRTAYDASVRAVGDHHGVRREAERLMVRGFLVKDGTLPNHAPRGRSHVDAFRITNAGREQLALFSTQPQRGDGSNDDD